MNSRGKICAALMGIGMAIRAIGFHPAIGIPVSTVARLPVISIERLPSEARSTIQLIEQGGPFPYPRKDGTVFGNRERLLPILPRGSYREYTVPTPGLRTRGARRIISAPKRIYYYTGDHYKTFQEVVN
jgi:ribonuclease T1